MYSSQTHPVTDVAIATINVLAELLYQSVGSSKDTPAEDHMIKTPT